MCVCVFCCGFLTKKSALFDENCMSSVLVNVFVCAKVCLCVCKLSVHVYMYTCVFACVCVCVLCFVRGVGT